MSLLVQRVSGSRYGSLFYPQLAGVGLSFNPYVWSAYIDPEGGMLRLVFGLGTRAVDRSDDDYTRVVALNAPERRPETDADEVRQYSQRKVDVIDLEANQLVSLDFAERGPAKPGAADRAVRLGGPSPFAAWGDERGIGAPLRPVLTFDRLLSETPFIADMREMLATLQDGVRVSGRHGIHGEFRRPGPVQDQPRAVPAAAGERRR